MARKSKPFLSHKKSGKFVSSKYLHTRGVAPDTQNDAAPKTEFGRFVFNFEQAIKKAISKK